MSDNEKPTGDIAGRDANADSGPAAVAPQVLGVPPEQDPLLHNFDDVPLVVAQVGLTGNRITKHDVLIPFIKPIMQARTMADLVARCRLVEQQLYSTGAFKEVRIFIEQADTSSWVGVPVRATISFVEKGRFCLSTSANISHKGPSSDVSFGFQNVFGRFESLRAEYSNLFPPGGIPVSKYTLSFDKPLLGGHLFSVRAVKGEIENQTESVHKEAFHSVQAQYTLGRHTLVYEGSWRDVQLVGNPSVRMFDEAGASFKSSVKLTSTFERRDNPRLPTRGSLFSFSHELAGLGGDVFFWKPTFKGQLNVPLGRRNSFFDWSLHFLGQGGAIFTPEGHRSRINDRFFLGYSDLRGFEHKGIGPRVHTNEAFGGDLFYTFTAFLSACTFNLLGAASLRPHVFAAIGNLVQAHPSKPWSQSVRDLAVQPRMAVGAGVAADLGMARFEVNYSVPVQARHYDQTRSWTIGASLNF